MERGPTPRFTPVVCEEIASQVFGPGTWVSELSRAGVSGDLVEPFLRRSMNLAEPDWSEHLTECMKTASLRDAAIAIVLEKADAPTNLLQMALTGCAESPRLINILCMRKSIAEKHLSVLLNHENREVAAAAALGMWYASPVGVIAPSLEPPWRNAFVQCQENIPTDAFKKDPLLARDWLAARFSDEDGLLPQDGPTFQAAFDALDGEQRLSLMTRLSPKAACTWEAVRTLVGDDAHLYRQLLTDERLKGFHLAPLQGWAEGAWAAKATLALEAGYSPEELSRAVRREGPGWGRSNSRRWARLVQCFDSLEGHPDQRIREVGRICREMTLRDLDRMKLREREERDRQEW